MPFPPCEIIITLSSKRLVVWNLLGPAISRAPGLYEITTFSPCNAGALANSVATMFAHTDVPEPGFCGDINSISATAIVETAVATANATLLTFILFLSYYIKLRLRIVNFTFVHEAPN